MKEESKAQKKVEGTFKWALTEANIDHTLSWDEVKEKLDLAAAEYAAIPDDEDRIRIYKVRCCTLSALCYFRYYRTFSLKSHCVNNAL